MRFRMDVSKKGLLMFFNEWQVSVLKLIWQNHPEGLDIKTAWDMVNQGLDRKISRSSVTKFVNEMVDRGFLGFEEEIDRGGARRIYYSIYNEVEFKRSLVDYIINKFLSEFPKATRIAIDKANS